MNKVEGPRRAKRTRKRLRSGRTLLIGRIAAGLLAALSVGLAVYMRGLALSPATLMWGSACVLLILLAVTLSVKMRVSKGLMWCLGIACVALIVGGYLNHFYQIVDGRFVPKYVLVTKLKVTDKYPPHFTQMESLETLDMRGSTVTDFEPIQALGSLRQADLRENYAFDGEAHDALARALPACDIRWSVPLHDIYFDSAAEAVDVSALPLTTQELRRLFADYPDKRFTYRVPLLEERYDGAAAGLDLQGKAVDVEALLDALELFPNLSQVDLRGNKASVQAVAALCEAHPDIHFVFTCDVPGDVMTTDDVKVKVKGNFDDLMARLSYADFMPKLELMDAYDIDLTDEQIEMLRTNALGDRLKYSVIVFGHRVSSVATELNLDNTPVPDVQAVEECIAKLPYLKCISMCDTGLSEAQMGQLFDAHPEIKFIWWIEFGQYRLRTDVTAFTTGLGGGNDLGYNQETFAPLRYCTDLMMLDLGHNRISNLEFIRGLKKLRVLILADNKLTDASVLAELTDLEYLEIFLNDLTDITPLTGLTHLMDVNIYHNPLYENHKPFATMPWLKRLWIGGCRLSKEDLANLKRALPNTKINIEGRSSTGMGWRKDPHYDVLLQMYEQERYIPFEDSQPLD